MSHNEREYTVDHQLSDRDENIHSAWNNSLDPVLSVESGDVVRFECRDAVDGQIDIETTVEDVPDVSFDPVHPLTGPMAVEGAEPGDVLEVELLDRQHKG